MRTTLRIILSISIVAVLIAGGLLIWPKPVVKPPFSVIAPRAGDSITMGTTQTIQWERGAVPAKHKISIGIRRIPPPDLQTEGQEFDPILFVNLPNTGSAEWVVSDRYPEGTYVLGITSYAEVPVTDPMSVESGAFTLIRAKPVPSDWYSTVDANGVTIGYPPDVGTMYIGTVDWPPAVQAMPEAFACHKGGVEIMPEGSTEQRIINGRTYCVTQQSEGAAGSVYTQYRYAFARDQQTMVLMFSLRFPQCANYDEPTRSACEREKAELEVDSIIDRIARTITP